MDLIAVRGVFDDLASVTNNAFRCRLADFLAAMTSIRLEVDSPFTYATDRTDSPGQQAENERRQIDRARAVMDTFEPSQAASFADGVRETHIAGRLTEFRSDGDAVAVVSRHHLGQIAELLDARLGGPDRRSELLVLTAEPDPPAVASRPPRLTPFDAQQPVSLPASQSA